MHDGCLKLLAGYPDVFPYGFCSIIKKKFNICDIAMVSVIMLR